MGIIWALLASLTAIGLELAYKSTERSWVGLLPFTLAPILFLNFALFQLLRGRPLLSAFILFGLCNLAIRIGANLIYLKEPVSKGIWIALGLVLLANLAKWIIK